MDHPQNIRVISSEREYRVMSSVVETSPAPGSCFCREFLIFGQNLQIAMKYRTILLALLLAAACTPFEPFTFVQMSDTQIGFMDPSPAFCHSDSLMMAAVDKANALEPVCVFITGDLVDNPSDPVQDSIFLVRLAQIEAPVYLLPGNHDYYGSSPEKREAFIARRGYDRFSFKEKGCAFIGINSNSIKYGTDEMEAEQFEWLQSELSATKGCKYTFVFLHCPIVCESMDEDEAYFNFSLEQRRRYVDLFRQYGVDIVFAGHCHQEFDTASDGIRFITAGPVCNPLGHGYPGYNVVKVGKDGVEVTYTGTRIE